MVMLNGDPVTMDELVRLNARMVVQHEADRLRIEQLEETAAVPLPEAQIKAYEDSYAALDHRMNKAVEVIHELMAGADRCQYCGANCKMLDDCKPVWKGAKP